MTVRDVEAMGGAAVPDPGEADRRRVKLAYLPESFLVNLLNLKHSVGPLASWEYVVVPSLEGMPDDATVAAVNYDHRRAAWAVRIRSATFEALKAGDLIPEMEIRMSTIRIDRAGANP